MIELRWLERDEPAEYYEDENGDLKVLTVKLERVLQMRHLKTRIMSNECISIYPDHNDPDAMTAGPIWSDWTDIPIETE